MLGVSLNVVWLQVFYLFIYFYLFFYFFSETNIHTRERKKVKLWQQLITIILTRIINITTYFENLIIEYYSLFDS